jgi:hypothetical protein
MYKTFLSEMALGEFCTHIREFPEKRDQLHHLAWAALRGQFSAEELRPVFAAPAYAGAQDFLVELSGRLGSGVTEEEREYLRLGRDVFRSAPLMSDEELRSVYLAMYKLEYIQCPELEKGHWNDFVECLFQALDPKGLTSRGLTKRGVLRARLGTVWTEEAALLVIRLNRILDPGPRTPSTVLAEMEEGEWAANTARVVDTYPDRAVEHLICPPSETEDTADTGAWRGRPIQCPLSAVRLFAALPRRRRSRIIRAIDKRRSTLEEFEAERRLFVWEDDWDGRRDDN